MAWIRLALAFLVLTIVSGDEHNHIVSIKRRPVTYFPKCQK